MLKITSERIVLQRFAIHHCGKITNNTITVYTKIWVCPYKYSCTRMGHIIEKESGFFYFILAYSDVGLESIVWGNWLIFLITSRKVLWCMYVHICSFILAYSDVGLESIIWGNWLAFLITNRSYDIHICTYTHIHMYVYMHIYMCINVYTYITSVQFNGFSQTERPK